MDILYTREDAAAKIKLGFGDRYFYFTFDLQCALHFSIKIIKGIESIETTKLFRIANGRGNRGCIGSYIKL